MKQLIQSLENGKSQIVDVPRPNPSKGELLVETRVSLISAGTERMLIEFGRANLIDKARQQPEKVKMVLDKVKTDGIVATYGSVKNKLSQPIALGYCNVGRILEKNAVADGLSVGDRVVCNGSHSELVIVKKNLCAKIPDGVSDDEAAFTVIGSIALQGVRLSNPTIGETFVVFGLGLVGLITVQILKANGCSVIGLDYNPDRLKLAEKFGAKVIDLNQVENPVDSIVSATEGFGADAVIIAASTNSQDIISQSAQVCRKRGRIVLVGTCGLNLKRDDFFKKEITFQVSASYGPGRYDPDYEDKGNDYPIGYVRWTQKRNFEAILKLLEQKLLDVLPLIDRRLQFENAPEAYELLTSSDAPIGILLEYPQGKQEKYADKLEVAEPIATSPASSLLASFLGTGNYATRHLMPAFRKSGIGFRSAVSKSGLSSWVATKAQKFQYISTNTQKLFEDEEVNIVVVATQHDTHARFAIEGLKHNKNVFLEKPLCIDFNQLEELKHFFATEWNRQHKLMIGYNRRFAPLTKTMVSLLRSVGKPFFANITVNAGTIDPSSWIVDKKVGGGRIVGELCHFVDFARFISGSKITSHNMLDLSAAGDESCSLSLEFESGDACVINYLTNGSRKYPKETIEIFCDGRVLKLDNFRSLKGFGWNAFSSKALLFQNKGQNECVAAFCKALGDGSDMPISVEEMLEIAEVCLEVERKLTD